MLGIGRAASTKAYQLIDTGTITSTGEQTYTIPLGTQYLEIELYGAGGGGAGRNTVGSGRSASNYGGAGGGGGSYLKKTYYGSADMQVSDTLTFTVGAGGAGGGANTMGTAGGHTTLDAHSRGGVRILAFNSPDVRAGAGSGGAVGTALDTTANGGAAGLAAGGDINTSGNAGADVTGSTNAQAGGAGGDGADPDGGDGGNGAGSPPVAGPASAGTAPGGGGGGGNSYGVSVNNLGKDGGAGKVIVKAYG